MAPRNMNSPMLGPKKLLKHQGAAFCILQRQARKRVVKLSLMKLKKEMVEIRKEQQCIKEEQRKVRRKCKIIESQCDHLRKETQQISQKSAATRLHLALIFQILKAREDNDFNRANDLSHSLRDLDELRIFNEILQSCSLDWISTWLTVTPSKKVTAYWKGKRPFWRRRYLKASGAEESCFGCRLLLKSLPSKLLLQRSGLHIANEVLLCVRCQKEEESVDHVFAYCEKVQKPWKKSVINGGRYIGNQSHRFSSSVTSTVMASKTV